MWHCKQYSFFSKLGLYMFAQSPIAPKICTSKFLSFARTWGGGEGQGGTGGQRISRRVQGGKNRKCPREANFQLQRHPDTRKGPTRQR